MQYLNQSILHFADIMIPLMIAAALFCRPCNHKDSDLGYWTATELAMQILRFHMQR